MVSGLAPERTARDGALFGPILIASIGTGWSINALRAMAAGLGLVSVANDIRFEDAHVVKVLDLITSLKGAEVICASRQELPLDHVRDLITRDARYIWTSRAGKDREGYADLTAAAMNRSLECAIVA